MTLVAGTKVGPYEILAAIGAGGMGEVYRARDARLNRDVAGGRVRVTFLSLMIFGIAVTSSHGQQARQAPMSEMTSGAGSLLGDDPSLFDEKIEAAQVRRDVAFINAVVAEDALFTHGSGTVWTKRDWLAAMKSPDARIFLMRKIEGLSIERHGDVIETTGHIDIKTQSTQRPEYQVYFVRIYARRANGWQFLSHRTIEEVEGSK